MSPILQDCADQVCGAPQALVMSQSGICECLDRDKADVAGASPTIPERPYSPGKSDLPADLDAQFKLGAGSPLKLTSPADDTELKQQRQRHRKANRESARRVRRRKTQQSSMFETQAAEVEATNQNLLKKVAEVQGRYLLAIRLLRALHLKVAHLQGLNESLQVRIARLQQQSFVQGHKCLDTGDLRPPLDSKASGVAPCSVPPAADLLCSPSSQQPVCIPPAPLEAIHPKATLAPGISPFATVAPATSPSQAVTPPGFATSGLHPTAETATTMPATSDNMARANSMDTMLASLDSDQFAAQTQHMNSLTLSFTLSATLDSYPRPAAQWQLPV
ncbi:hypothetical protein ABBQ32_005734 [Trebouxia sp. C0010 RCD-2024]